MNKLVLFAFLFVVAVVAVSWIYLAPEEDADLDTVEVEFTEPTRSEPHRRGSLPDRRGLGGKEPQIPMGLDVPINNFGQAQELDAKNSTLVRVVNAKTQKAVANCDVSVLEMGPFLAADGKREIKTDFLGFSRARGLHYQTSAAGEVRIPLSEETWVVGAYVPGKFGRGTIPTPPPAEIKIELQETINLAARVLDSRRNPVSGAGVEFGVVHLKKDRGQRWHQSLARGTTDGKGVAHLHAMGASVNDTIKFPKGKRFYLAAEGVLVPRAEVEFELDQLPKNVVDLQLKPAGSLTVKILDTDGSLCTDRIHVRVLNAETAALVIPYDAWKFSLFEGSIDSGVLQIPFVTTGIKLSITVMGPGSALQKFTKIIDGPTQFGENLQATLQFEKRRSVVRGRIVGPEGKPIADARFATRIESKQKFTGIYYNSLRTDHDGRFELVLKSDFRITKKVRSRSLSLSRGENLVVTPMTATVALPSDPILADLDIGDVTLHQPNRLVSGLVLDVNGVPVLGARIKLSPVGLFLGRLVADRFGRFSAYGDLVAPWFRVMVTAEGYISKAEQVRNGAAGVTIYLDHPATVKGRFVLANGSHSGGLVAFLHEEGSANRHRCLVWDNGLFRADDLRPGTYNLTVYGNKSDRKELLSRKSIIVGSGETKDMGEVFIQFEGIRIEMVLEEPKKIKGGVFVVVRDQTSGKELRRILMTRGRETIFVSAQTCELQLTADGYRQTTLRNVTGGKTPLRLTPGIPVHFVFANPQDVPKGYVVEFFVDPNLGTGPFWLKNIGRNFTQPFHSPGSYRMSATLSTLKNRRRTTRLPVASGDILVLDSASDQTFSLRMSVNDLEAATERLRRR